jgi:hypothetical protein
VTAPFLAPERDDAAKWGRGKSAGASFYTVPGQLFSVISSLTGWAADTDYYEPWFTPTPIVVDQLACEVTAAGTNIRIGLYRADADWQPIGAPLADSGSIEAGTGVKTYTPGTPLYLPRGRYLAVGNLDNAATALRNFRGTAPTTMLDSALGATAFVIKTKVARAYAAFPTPGTPWDTVETSSTAGSRVIVFRVSTP